MIIHVVKPGDSIYKIARQHGVTPQKVLADNELAPDEQLVIGQTIVVLTPNAPKKLGTIEVNGYVLPTAKMDTVQRTLPSLTYLSIFSYQVKADGTLTSVKDESLIAAARAAKVAPIMVINNIGDSGFSSDIAHAVLVNETVQATMIENIIKTLKAKNYYGLNIDFEYIYSYDRASYNLFLRKITKQLKALGYIVMTALAPKTSATQPGLLYEAHDYKVHGEVADRVILMTYEWGYSGGPPLPVSPVNKVRQVLDYAVTAIPHDKILMGMPNYGYNWTLPYNPKTTAPTIGNVEAVRLARTVKARIQYDALAQTPFFNYYDANKKQHIVWFDDARSIRAKLLLVNEYQLAGVSYWTIGRYFPQNWLVLNAMYDVKKVL